MFQSNVSLRRDNVSVKQYETKIFKNLKAYHHEEHEVFLSFFLRTLRGE